MSGPVRLQRLSGAASSPLALLLFAFALLAWPCQPDALASLSLRSCQRPAKERQGALRERTPPQQKVGRQSVEPGVSGKVALTGQLSGLWPPPLPMKFYHALQPKLRKLPGLRDRGPGQAGATARVRH